MASLWSRLAHFEPPRERDLSLAVNQAASLGRPGSGLELRCVSGSLLVTQEGAREDHVLGAGERIRLAGRGRVVALALAAAELEVAPVSASTGPVPESSASWNGATFGTSWK